MRRGSFQAVSPAGLLVGAVTTEPDRLLIVARPSAADAVCPECGRRSSQVHSRYDRRLTDLPSQGRAVHLRIQIGRFRCVTVSCPRRIFGELLAESIAPRVARRTARLENVVHHLGQARRPTRRKSGAPTDAPGQPGHAVARATPPGTRRGRARPGHRRRRLRLEARAALRHAAVRP